MARAQEITIIARFINKVTKPLFEVNKTIETTVNRFKQIRGGLLGVNFGLLFMGMAINRAVDGALKSAINAYKIMGAEQTIFNVKTNELAAAWEFFKFTLIDALSQSSLFVVLIDWVINLINWFSQLPEGTKQIIMIGLAATWVASKIAMVVGQIGLFIGSLAMISPVAVLKVVAAFIKLAGAMLANPWTWIVIGLLAIITIVGYCVSTFDSFKNALKFFGGFAIWLFALIGDSIIESMLLPIRLLIKVLDAAIIASNALFGTKFRTIGSLLPEDIRPGMLTRKAESYLAGAEWFQPAVQDVQDKGTMKDYMIGVVGELTGALTTAVTNGMDRAFEKNNLIVGTPNG